MKIPRLLFALAFPFFGLFTAVYTGCGSEGSSGSNDPLISEDPNPNGGVGYGYGYGTGH